MKTILWLEENEATLYGPKAGAGEVAASFEPQGLALLDSFS
jgi:hypothetical protein